MSWFSSKVRFVCLIEDKGAVRYMDNIYIFTAKNFEEAHLAAIKIGRKEEASYKNIDGKMVKWLLKELISLDCLLGELDGSEIYSEPVALGPNEQFPFTVEFCPETSQPTQTI